MKVNELRVNIFVNDTKDKKNIQITDLDAWRIAEDYHYFEPIPLTEEWLIKFGFIKGKDKYLSPCERSENGHFDRMVFDLNDLDFIVNSNDYDGWYVHCKYVHQLQNLYFALTSEELQCKEI